MAGFPDIAEAGPPDAVFAALDGLARTTVGARLVTCSVFDTELGLARRVHTSDPDSYPLSGMKGITANRWTESVLDRREMFVANTIGEIREVFPDHETIAGLGLGAVLNLPVVLAGRLLGTVNLLDREGTYGWRRVAAASALRLPAIAAFASLPEADDKG